VKLFTAATVVLAIGVSACGLLPIPPPIEGIGPNAPAMVASRIPVPSCGVERGGHDGPWNIEGRACFWQAYRARRPAEFISTRPTIEGDPITSIYRVLPDGSVEVFIDSTQDTFGSGKWSHATCRTLSEQVGADLDFGPDDTCVFVDIT